MSPAASTPSIGFRPLLAGDLALLERWLETPHWRDWWGDSKDEMAMFRDMVEGRDPNCDPFIFEVDGEPTGYIQVWRIGPHQTPEWAGDNPWLMEVPADAVGLDLSIGDGAHLSRGLGSAALRAFTARLWDDGHRTIIIDPNPANGRAVAAYAKAGFRPIPHLEGRTAGVLIMQFQPDGT